MALKKSLKEGFSHMEMEKQPVQPERVYEQKYRGRKAKEQVRKTGSGPICLEMMGRCGKSRPKR